MTVSMGRTVAAALVACLVLPAAVGAQKRTTHAADLAIGSAIGNGGPFDYRHMSNARLGVSRRTGRDSAVALFFEGSLNATMHSICGPTGRCVGDYPELVGLGMLIGGLLAPRRNVEFRFGLGGTIYTVTNSPNGRQCASIDPTCGTISTGGTLAFTAVSDVAIFPVKHLGFVVGRQYVIMPGYRVFGDPHTLWMAPLTFGVRVR
jgi:hypothetical protein